MCAFVASRRCQAAGFAVLALFAGLLGGCGHGSSAEPPTNVTAVAGDGRATVSWSGETDVEYWLFGAADASISADNWSSLPGALVEMNVKSPAVVCNLANDTAYYFQMNGRRDGGPGGARSATASATTRMAGVTWQAGSALGSSAWRAVTERGGQVCSATESTVVNYVAVGDAGRVMTSIDARTWVAPVSLPAGFATALNGVAASGGTSARWVAVGDQGAVLLSTDGATWTQGVAPSTGAPALRAVASNGSVFVAVGDGGTVKASSDGSNWSTHNTGVTENLRGVAYSANGYFVVVGDGGTVLYSGDSGLSWARSTLPEGFDAATAPFTAVATGVFNVTTTVDGTTSSKSVYSVVVAGRGGRLLVSQDAGATFVAAAPTVAQGADTATDFVAIARHGRFVLIDAGGRAWPAKFDRYDPALTISTWDGKSWDGPLATNLSAPTAAVGANGRYVAVDASGAAAVSF